MSLKLAALIKKTEAAIAAEKDPEKLEAMYADLAAYKKVKKHVETTESEEGADDDEEPGDDGDDDKDEDDEEDEEEDEKKSTKSKKAAKSEDDEDEEDEEDEEEESASASEEEEEAKSAKAILAVAKAAVPGAKGRKALVGGMSALIEQANKVPDLLKRLAKIEGTGRKAQRETLIENALAKRLITKPQAAAIGKKSLEFVQSYLAIQKTPLVHNDEEGMPSPDASRTTSAGSLTAEQMADIDRAVAATQLKGDAAAKLKTSMITNAKAAVANGSNVNGRY